MSKGYFTLALLAAALLHGSASAQPVGAGAAADAEKLALARDIVAITYPPETRLATFGGAVKSLIAQMRGGQNNPPWMQTILTHVISETEEQTLQILQRHLPDMVDSYAHAYTHAYTLDELRQIDAFAHSPAGGHFLVNQINLLSDPAVGAANRSYMAETMPIMQNIQAKARREVGEYIAAHPEVVKQH